MSVRKEIQDSKMTESRQNHQSQETRKARIRTNKKSITIGCSYKQTPTVSRVSFAAEQVARTW